MRLQSMSANSRSMARTVASSSQRPAPPGQPLRSGAYMAANKKPGPRQDQPIRVIMTRLHGQCPRYEGKPSQSGSQTLGHLFGQWTQRPHPRKFLVVLFRGTLAEVRIVVTEVTGQGSIRRGVLDTADCGDADRCDDLIQRAALNVPPPYRPVEGGPVYEIWAGDEVIWVARRDLAGPLLELVMTTLAGEHPSAGQGAAGASARDCPAGRHEQQLPEA